MMPNVRRAFVWASFARYFNITLNLATTLLVVRIVSSASYGVSVMALSVFALAEALREFGGGAYLIQHRELTIEKIRTSVTVNALVTIAVAALLLVSVDGIAGFYKIPEIKSYINVSLTAYLCGPFIYPILALLNRDLKFRRIAFVTVAMTSASSAATIGLAFAGFEYMSFAIANVVAAAVGVCLCQRLAPRRRMYRPSLGDWREVTAFGAFNCLASLAAAFLEFGPYLALGRFLPTSEVAIAQRAMALAYIPERVLLAGVGALALSEFSRRAQQPSELRRAYLATLELSTAIYWPALVGLALLADPIVALLFGPKWREVATLLPLLCVAFSFAFPLALQYPVLVAAGAVRTLPGLIAAQGALAFAAVAVSARFGLLAVAWAVLICGPGNVFLGNLVIGPRLGLRWGAFAWSLRKSFMVAALSACGPLAVMLATQSLRLSIGGAAIAVVAMAACWGAGLWLTGHPLESEIRRVISRRASSVAARLRLSSGNARDGGRAS